MIVTFDYETSIKCPIGNSKAHPMWKGNKVVWHGYKVDNGPTITGQPIGPKERFPEALTLAIGQNIKFDLLYRYRDVRYGIIPAIWDIQLAEYILSGQSHLYPSLDEMAVKYGLPVKDSKMKEYWDKGVDTEDIPEEEIVPYLRTDVENTYAIAMKQMEEAISNGQMPLITEMMEALRATTVMNLHGMAVDWKHVEDQRALYDKSAETLRRMLEVDAPGLDPASPKQLSLFFFGGEEKYVERELVGKYKNGKDKYKNVEKTRTIPPKIAPEAVGLKEPGKSGYYTVNDEVLSNIVEHKLHGYHVANSIKDLRSAEKIATTFYGGLQEAKFPDGFIYPNLNHTSTATGRLSATAPNLQTMTDIGGIKKSFVSRYGSHGKLVEFDYSQLEMVGAAYYFDDEQLIEDINAGRDMHTELFTEMYGRAPSKSERKAFKPRTFQLIYGASASAISKQGKIPLSEAKKFVEVFYNRYSGIARGHAALESVAKRQSYISDPTTGRREYVLTTATGRKYVFNTFLNERDKWVSGKKKRVTEWAFSLPQLKNYPIQGFATGDVVPMVVGAVQRVLEARGLYGHNKCTPIMTVHDSLLLDVHDDVLDNVISVVREVMQSAPKMLKDVYGIEFPCKLSVGCSVGPNWGEMKEIV